MSREVPVLNTSKAPESEFYVMECVLTVRRVEILGNSRTERNAEFRGYMSKEVLESTLDVMREVVGE